LEETKKVMKKVNAEDFLYVIIQYDSCKFWILTNLSFELSWLRFIQEFFVWLF
jgi:hypothetical protein